MTDPSNSTATGGDSSTHNNRTEEDYYIPAPRKPRSGKQWVAVEAASLEELSAKISALCDLLIPEQRRKPE